jgi:ubiquinone/menaquinone biosynthesis C-methylase UbiE
MDSRGEKDFEKFSKIAVKFYDYITRGTLIKRQNEEIAQFLISKITPGNLLDVGTGPGRLFIEISKLKSDIELYGLDISNSMIEQAQKNLKNKKVNLRVGNIEKTEYEDNFFDIITATGNLFLWDHPQECLEK